MTLRTKPERGFMARKKERSEMHYIVVPPDVKIIDKRSGKPVPYQRTPEDKPEPWIITHDEFVIDILCASAAILEGGGDGLRRQLRLQTAFENCHAGDVIGVDGPDYLAAKRALGTIGWSPQAARFASQMLPHIAAWEAAEKQTKEWKQKRETDTTKPLGVAPQS